MHTWDEEQDPGAGVTVCELRVWDIESQVL